MILVLNVFKRRRATELTENNEWSMSTCEEALKLKLHFYSICCGFVVQQAVRKSLSTIERCWLITLNVNAPLHLQRLIVAVARGVLSFTNSLLIVILFIYLRIELRIKLMRIKWVQFSYDTWRRAVPLHLVPSNLNGRSSSAADCHITGGLMRPRRPLLGDDSRRTTSLAMNIDALMVRRSATNDSIRNVIIFAVLHMMDLSAYLYLCAHQWSWHQRTALFYIFPSLRILQLCVVCYIA